MADISGRWHRDYDFLRRLSESKSTYANLKELTEEAQKLKESDDFRDYFTSSAGFQFRMDAYLHRLVNLNVIQQSSGFLSLDANHIECRLKLLAAEHVYP